MVKETRTQEQEQKRQEQEQRKQRLHRVETKSSTRNSIVRVVFFVILVIIQFWWIYLLITGIESRIPWFSTLISAVALVMVMTIYSRNMNSAYRMFWMVVVGTFPVLGIPFYAIMGRKNSTKRARDSFARIDLQLKPFLKQQDGILDKLAEKDTFDAGASHYLWYTAGFPLYQHTDTRFFPDASAALDQEMADMRNAKKFIFMEYFAIEEQGIYQQIFRILREKVAEGVEVRLIYDDIGSLSFINTEFIRHMEAAGIKCVRFNPFFPVLNIFVNNRDHRKICVIDGKVGYTGGYNLANEYFNITSPYGHWKDTGIRMEGEAVHTFTLCFLEMWDLINKLDPVQDAERYLSGPVYSVEGEGFVQPYADSPLDNEQTGEEVYMNILRGAKKYAYFVTPYLIITDEMRREMVGAAKRGVDVRIITPGIPDKKMVYQETRSYYSGLVRGGVRIFEYTPGFCHAKMSVADDRTATVGTINLDFRSLYLHFEDGVLIHNNHAVLDIKKDFDEMFAQSKEVTDRYYKGAQTLPQRIWRAMLRFIAPLL